MTDELTGLPVPDLKERKLRIESLKNEEALQLQQEITDTREVYDYGPGLAVRGTHPDGHEVVLVVSAIEGASFAVHDK